MEKCYKKMEKSFLRHKNSKKFLRGCALGFCFSPCGLVLGLGRNEAAAEIRGLKVTEL